MGSPLSHPPPLPSAWCRQMAVAAAPHVQTGVGLHFPIPSWRCSIQYGAGCRRRAGNAAFINSTVCGREGAGGGGGGRLNSAGLPRIHSKGTFIGLLLWLNDMVVGLRFFFYCREGEGHARTHVRTHRCVAGLGTL